VIVKVSVFWLVFDNKFERVRKWKDYRTLFTLGLISVFGSPN